MIAKNERNPRVAARGHSKPPTSGLPQTSRAVGVRQGSEPIYTGRRIAPGVCLVQKDGRRLSKRLGLKYHTSKFDWGCRGNGALQLALALTADAIADDRRALRIYQILKNRVIIHIRWDSQWSVSHRRLVEIIDSCDPDISGLKTTPDHTKSLARAIFEPGGLADRIRGRQ